MKILISSFILSSGIASQAAIVLTNGDFSTNSTTGWTTTGTVTATSGAAVLSSGATLAQDFENGTGLVAFTASYDVSFGAINNAHRMRFEGDNGNDLITLRLASANTIETFNNGSWTSAVTGLSLAANTTYTLSITGTGFGAPGFKYTIEIFSGSTQLGTSVQNLSARHANGDLTFQTFTLGASTGGMTVDNFTVIPEPAAALLGGFGLLGLLRRRRA